MSRGRILSASKLLQQAKTEAIRVHRTAYGDRHVRLVVKGLLESGQLKVASVTGDITWYVATSKPGGLSGTLLT